MKRLCACACASMSMSRGLYQLKPFKWVGPFFSTRYAAYLFRNSLTTPFSIYPHFLAGGRENRWLFTHHILEMAIIAIDSHGRMLGNGDRWKRRMDGVVRELRNRYAAYLVEKNGPTHLNGFNWYRPQDVAERCKQVNNYF